jgi:EAL domain-containing protein (putative c-di-GMP-specific phosphodiesterase class I)
MNGSILPLVREALARHVLAPELLEVEILEETAVKASDNAYGVLSGLCKMGVSIALDDFGTGYSSLVYLSRIPANVLKIDRAFTRDILTSPRQKTLLHHIVSLVKVLDYTVVAEGVEEREQLDMLRAMGRDTIQGYLFGKPVPAAAFARILQPGRTENHADSVIAR